jgi:alpha-galactosidase/6-phospho-beta-glucosidase family protein
VLAEILRSGQMTRDAWMGRTTYPKKVVAPIRRVMNTEVKKINLCSPSDIREKATELLEAKQRHLEIAIAFMIVVIVLAFIMVVFRLRVG